MSRLKRTIFIPGLLSIPNSNPVKDESWDPVKKEMSNLMHHGIFNHEYWEIPYRLLNRKTILNESSVLFDRPPRDGVEGCGDIVVDWKCTPGSKWKYRKHRCLSSWQNDSLRIQTIYESKITYMKLFLRKTYVLTLNSLDLRPHFLFTPPISTLSLGSATPLLPPTNTTQTFVNTIFYFSNIIR